MHKEKPMPCAVQGESSTVELSEQSEKENNKSYHHRHAFSSIEHEKKRN